MEQKMTHYSTTKIGVIENEYKSFDKKATTNFMGLKMNKILIKSNSVVFFFVFFLTF